MLKMMNVPYNNYKTQLCKFWEKEGKCKFNKNCSYAHGEAELRKPYEALPMDIGTYQKATGASLLGKRSASEKRENEDAFERMPDGESKSQQRFDYSNLRILMNSADEFSQNQILQANNLI
jgi:hypothetical protein